VNEVRGLAPRVRAPLIEAVGDDQAAPTTATHASCGPARYRRNALRGYGVGAGPHWCHAGLEAAAAALLCPEEKNRREARCVRSAEAQTPKIAARRTIQQSAAMRARRRPTPRSRLRTLSASKPSASHTAIKQNGHASRSAATQAMASRYASAGSQVRRRYAGPHRIIRTASSSTAARSRRSGVDCFGEWRNCDGTGGSGMEEFLIAVTMAACISQRRAGCSQRRRGVGQSLEFFSPRRIVR